jgi:hypothetical protein
MTVEVLLDSIYAAMKVELGGLFAEACLAALMLLLHK